MKKVRAEAAGLLLAAALMLLLRQHGTDAARLSPAMMQQEQGDTDTPSGLRSSAGSGAMIMSAAGGVGSRRSLVTISNGALGADCGGAGPNCGAPSAGGPMPSAVAQAQPASPGSTIAFSEGFSNLWGPRHQNVTQDQKAVILSLDRTSGSGFKSNKSYRSGYFGASIKVQSGNTTGVNTAFFLSNDERYSRGDEIAVEVLGAIPSEPSTLRTNVHSGGNGEEMRFHLWFDPAADYHHYAVLWNPDEIVFIVDDVPVRRYQKKVEATYPAEREMWVYGCVWDASAWSTDPAVDYRYSPFASHFQTFRLPTAGVLDTAPPPTTRRHLGAAYISYDAMRADFIPCNKRTGTDANCHIGKAANNYTRGCTYIQQCARNMD